MCVYMSVCVCMYYVCVCMYVRISLYSCKIVDKEILRLISNIGIYCSSDKGCAVNLAQ